jgi:Ni/Co efflux regulator RcnB
MKFHFAGHHPFVAVVAVAAMALTSATAFAAPPSGPDQDHRDLRPSRHDNDHGDRGDQGHQNRAAPARHARAPQAQERPEFSANESRLTRDYFKQHHWDAKPLPHGRHYAIGKRVPREYWHPLPPDLRGRFPHREGYEPYIVGDNVVLIAVATGVIVDILTQVH